MVNHNNEHQRVGRRGFTLIELLVAVAIIAILAALLLPVLSGARARTHAISCLNNVRQLSLACQLYTDDFRDWLPYNLGQADIARAVGRNRYYNWSTPVMSWELDSDNTNTTLVTRGGIGPYTSRNARIYQCPGDKVVSEVQRQNGWNERVRSISMNAMVGNAGEYTRDGSNVNNPGYVQYFKLSQIAHPSQIFVFIDEHPDSINDGYFLNRHHAQKWTDLPASFHNAGSALTFADGHGELHQWKSASTRPPSRPYAANLPFAIPAEEQDDFEWLMNRTSTEE